MVSSTGQLGSVKSAARYKRDIRDMGHSSDALMKLRPVTFRYKEDPRGELQYGLIAEEVARQYPNLVSRGPDGRAESVRYLTLISMLLNEVQKQNEVNVGQSEQIKGLTEKVAEERVRRITFEQRLSALEKTIAARENSSKLLAAFAK